MAKNNSARDFALEVKSLDTFSAAEKITGESYKNSKETEVLGLYLHIQKTDLERKVFSDLGDTRFDITWKEFLSIIKNYGFELIVDRKYTYEKYDDKKDLSFIVAAHPKKYLLLGATSWKSGNENETVNGGTVYGTLKNKRGALNQDSWNTLSGCSHGPSCIPGKGFRKFSLDVRTGLISHLSVIEEHFDFVKWHDSNRFLWLVDCNQDNEDDPGYKEWNVARDEFLSEAPKWVREFIFPSLSQKIIQSALRIYRVVVRFIHRQISRAKYFFLEIKWKLKERARQKMES